MTRRTRLTTRAALLGVVLVVLALTFVYPLKLLIAQRQQLNQMAAQNEAQRKHVESLTETVKRYNDPAWVANQARLRLHYVKPGETVLIVTPSPSPTPIPGTSPSPAAGLDQVRRLAPTAAASP